MKIIDTFEHERKMALYLDINGSEIPPHISNAVYDGKTYTICKYDILNSISGKKSVVVLIDTQDEFRLGENIFLT